MENLNIYQKMVRATAEIGTVAKNLQIKQGTGTYKAVSERDIIDAVKPVEEKLGIYSYPYERTIVESGMLEKQSQNGKRQEMWIRIETTYRFINTENPSEYIDVTAYGDGIDSGDKATGKAVTYADKYALMKAYKISTGDDPDQDESESYAKPAHLATPTQVGIIKEAYKDCEDKLVALLQKRCLLSVEELTLTEASELIKKLNERNN